MRILLFCSPQLQSPTFAILGPPRYHKMRILLFCSPHLQSPTFAILGPPRYAAFTALLPFCVPMMLVCMVLRPREATGLDTAMLVKLLIRPREATGLLICWKMCLACSAHERRRDWYNLQHYIRHRYF